MGTSAMYHNDLQVLNLLTFFVLESCEIVEECLGMVPRGITEVSLSAFVIKDNAEFGVLTIHWPQFISLALS